MCVAVPLKVTRLIGDGQAIAGANGLDMEINTILIPEVREGDYVLVHAGFALELLDEGNADEINRALAELYPSLNAPSN